ncbi:ATP-dependent dethiobiotin synthetase BioD, partial [Synechococcus sp. Cruz CV12-2-Slac-r]|uniref:ATP-dependent dethiobiotin synthetase BioD n=1 Tax=Synechococcus sp. Cruz CV12-2-Slac-r TaxID=2823748 RepID=UPI0020CB891A
DQVKAWNLPVVLVARSGLGTLNHTLLSIEALENRNIKVATLILNGEKHKENYNTLVTMVKSSISIKVLEIQPI